MSAPLERTGQGLAVIGAALVFGLGADILGRTMPDRLGATLILGTLALAGGYLVYRDRVPVPRGLGPLAVPFALLAVALIWRDSEALYLLNLLGIALLLGLAAPRLRAVGRRRGRLGDYIVGAVQVGAGTAAGAVPLIFSDIDWRSLPDGGGVHRARRALVGLIAAAPVTAIFGGLLMDADPVFDHMVSTAFGSSLEDLVAHGVAVAVWTWLGAGVLRLLLLQRPERIGDGGWTPAGRFTLAEVGTVLLVVNLLFGAFVAVQFRYLFGGAEMVRGLTGLSYAEYAREGFFQLVTVAALSLPLLLAADAMLGRRDPGSLRRFRALAVVMVVLLNIMLASALMRMSLYTAEYGLTELRFYTTAFMGWLVVVFGWFAGTVLRGRSERFGFGAVGAALLLLVVLNVINPDALIASSNLARAGRGRDLDAAYLGRLSADAFPAIRSALPSLPSRDRCAVELMLRDRTQGLRQEHRWNISRARAARVPVSGRVACP